MTKNQLKTKLSFLPFEYNYIKEDVVSVLEKDQKTITRLKKENKTLKARLNIATTNTKPIVHAHWVGKTYGGKKIYDDWSCSKCGRFVNEEDRRRLGKYCENCGAVMDEKEV